MAKTAPKGARGSAAGKKGKRGSGKGSGGAPADAAAAGAPHSARKLAVRATTRKGRRALAAREPKETEDLKATVMLYGRKVSQVVKDVMADLARLKPGEVTRLTRLNPDAAPFDPAGSAGASSVEALARKADAGLFVLGAHTKKRPHALTVGRLFDGRLLDAVEFGIDPASARLLKAFGSAPAAAQAGHKPALAFVGSAFEAHPAAAAAKSLLLDLFRGRVVPAVNLAGVDRLILVVAEGGAGGGGGPPTPSSSAAAPHPPPPRLSLRQFGLRLKKSGTRTPRVEATEIGPALDLSLKRHLPGPPDLVKAALKAAAGPTKKKEKNVSTDALDGKVGRLYVPRQDLAGLALAKAKGVKRARREAAAERAASAAAGGGGGGGGGGGAGAAGEESE